MNAQERLVAVANEEGRCVYGIHKVRGSWIGYQDRPAGEVERRLGRNVDAAATEIRRLSKPVVRHLLLMDEAEEFYALTVTIDPFDGRREEWRPMGCSTIEYALMWAREEGISFDNERTILGWIKEGRE